MLFLNQAEAPTLIFLNKKRKGGLALGIAATDQPTLWMGGADGLQRLGLSVNPGGATSLFFNDSAGHPRAILNVESDGTPTLKFTGPDGNIQFQAPPIPR